MIPRIVQKHFLIFIVLVVVISRLPAFAMPILDASESDFAVQTIEWIKGGIPYVEFVDKKPLVIHAWFGWIFRVFGDYNMTAVHAMDILLILLTILGVYYLTRYTSGEKVARWSAILYAFFQSFYDLNDFFSTSAESLMNFFAVFGAYAFFKSMREDRPGMSLLAGALMGVSILSEQAGIALLLASAVSLFWFWYEQDEHKWHRYAEEFFLLIVGVLFPIMLHIAYLTDIGGYNGFVRWTWLENLSHASIPAGAITFLKRALLQGGRFIAATWALWLLAGWAVLFFARKHKWRTEVIFALAWILFSIPMISRGGIFHVRYFLQLLPPLVMLAAIGVVGGWEQFIKKQSLSRKGLKAARIAAVCVALYIPYAAFIAFHVMEVKKLEEKDAPLKSIASYVKLNTKPGDRIFVWGDDSEVYFYSRRRPATRFADCIYLTGIKEGYESDGVTKGEDLNAWVMLKEDFDRHPPKLIVDFSPTGRKGYGAHPIYKQMYLANYVKDNYDMVRTVEGARIYVRKY